MTSIVTGAGQGNGAAIAILLRQLGHYVIGIDRQSISIANAHVCLFGDVTDATIINRAFSYTEGEPVNLINNAGITGAEWDKTIDTNLTAPYRWSKRYAEKVKAGRIESGSIVFIGSLASTLGFPDNPSYQASKAGILGLTRSFAYDLAPKIRVNCVSPGYIETAMTAGSFNDPEKKAARTKHTMLSRWGTPLDVAKAVAFLVGQDAGYITGINLPVDGGWTAKGLIE